MNPHPQSLHANSSETSAVLILSGKAGVSHSRLPFIGCGQQNPESTFQAKDHTRDRVGWQSQIPREAAEVKAS